MLRDPFVKATSRGTNEQTIKISPFVDAQEKAFPAERVVGYGTRCKSATGRLSSPWEPGVTREESMRKLTRRAAVQAVTPTLAERFAISLLSPAQVVFIAGNTKSMNPV